MKYVVKENLLSERKLKIDMREKIGNEEYRLVVAYGPNKDAKKEGKDICF